MESPRLVDNLQLLSYITNQTNKRDVAWEVIIQHGIQYFNYPMIKSLILNTHFDEILRQTAQKRKKYVSEYTCCFRLQNDITYHEWPLYGAINGNIGIQSSEYQSAKTIYIERQCLLNPMCEYHYFASEKFYDVLPHKPQPFFNRQGDFCFYGYGEMSDLFNDMSGTVTEYSLSVNGVKKIAECVTFVNKELFKLRLFLEMPRLLEAILNSSQAYHRRVGIDHRLVKIFDLEGETIPKHYVFHKKYFSKKVYAYFYNLPEELRKRIVALYKKQKQKKQKKALLKFIGQ